MFLFRKTSTSRLGIDIGASAIKVVELEKKEGRYELKNYGIFPLAYNSPEKMQHQIYLEPLTIPTSELVEIINRILKETKIVSKKAYFSIPVYSGFSTMITLPRMSKGEIASAVNFEARKYVPVPISEVVLDWSSVNLSDKESEIQILLVAVLKETLSDYNQIIKSVGLDMQGIEMENFSLSRALVGNDKSPIVLIDSGARSSNISIIDKGYIRVAHNLETGGLKMTRDIAEKMRISMKEAEEKKNSLNSLNEQEKTQIREIINSVTESIVFGSKRVIEAYQKKYNHKIEKCILVGGAAGIPGYLEAFSSKLNIETSIGNPFARIVYPPILEPILKELGPSLSVSIGLAMRD